MPEMIEVKSSNLAKIGYDAEKKEPHVMFKGNPKVYVYLDVPEIAHTQLNEAKSVGSCFAVTIKGKYNLRQGRL